MGDHRNAIGAVGGSHEPNRAYELLTRDHLDRLVEIARQDRESLFESHPAYGVFRDRILTVALCQGGALHFLDCKNGVKDLDVWTLYAAHPGVTYPYRRMKSSKGCEMPGLSDWTKRVDLLGRSLPFPIGHDPAAVWQAYLEKPRTKTSLMLANKPVVLLEPASRRGEVVWPSTL